MLSTFLEGFRKDLEEIAGETVSDRLKVMLRVIIRAGVEYRDLVTIFREGQYRFPEYEKELRDLYVSAVRRVYGRDIDEAEYLFIISGVRFVSTRSLYHDIRVDLESVQRFIEHGFFDDTVGPEAVVFRAPERDIEEPEPENSRGRIKQAALRLFGERGFYRVHVFEIARAAGFSVGTFYMHFESKEACLAEIVTDIGHNTRRYISVHLDRGLNRLETELQGMYLFLKYFEKNIRFYDIVREAEFVVNPAVTEYYNAFERGYIHSLGHLSADDAVTAANMLMGISHYLGIEVFFSGRVPRPEKLILKLAGYLSRGIEG